MGSRKKSFRDQWNYIEKPTMFLPLIPESKEAENMAGHILGIICRKFIILMKRHIHRFKIQQISKKIYIRTLPSNIRVRLIKA